MVTEVMYSSKTDMWETPQWFFDELNEEFHFDLDACATPDNKKVAAFFLQSRTAWRRIGVNINAYGATLHMGERYQSGVLRQARLHEQDLLL